MAWKALLSIASVQLAQRTGQVFSLSANNWQPVQRWVTEDCSPWKSLGKLLIIVLRQWAGVKEEEPGWRRFPVSLMKSIQLNHACNTTCVSTPRDSSMELFTKAQRCVWGAPEISPSSFWLHQRVDGERPKPKHLLFCYSSPSLTAYGNSGFYRRPKPCNFLLEM